MKIYALLIVEDNSLFQDMFQSATDSLNEVVNLNVHTFADKAEEAYKKLVEDGEKPDVVFIDINLDGSTFNGLELLRKINFEYGNDVVVGIISTSDDQKERKTAIEYGAQFWIKKSGDLDDILPEFMKDLPRYKSKNANFKIYE